MIKKISKIALRHKFFSGFITIALISGSYYGYKAINGNDGETKYLLAVVEKGTLITSVTGSGQVEVENEVNVKSKVSGDVIYANAKNGQEIKAGTIIAQVDSTDAQKSVRDAETALETAKLELEDLLKPADELTLLQAENSLIQLKESKQAAEDNLNKAYEDGFNTVSAAFFDLPALVAGIKGIIRGNDMSASQDNIAAYSDMVRFYEAEKVERYQDIAERSYDAVYSAYTDNFDHYKSASRYSESAVIEALIDETFDGAKKIAEAIKDADNFISFVKDALTERGLDVPKIVSTHQTSIKTDTSKVNSIVSNLLSIRRTIKNSKEEISKTQRAIEEKELSLKKLKEGADALSVRAKKINVRQKEDALVSARQNLADFSVRAPFSGVLAEVNAKKGDSVSGGMIIATLITGERLARISLNEIDMAKIKVGQKANLTFDAIAELGLTGEVVETDTIGTVNQGVVTYDVKIGLDTVDERVKPGMSVSASIITDVKQDALLVPRSAVKTQGDRYYVEVFEGQPSPAQGNQAVASKAPPRERYVEIGASNDVLTEIISGIKEGELVAARTIAPSANKSAQAQAPSIFGAGGRSSGGGGATFMRFR